ncbi:MAG: hypothetical protein ACOZNI_17535 [Myxococcota bacterium]
MLAFLLLACRPHEADGDPAGGEETPAPTGWAEPFTWRLEEARPCPAEVPDGDALGDVLAALGLDWDLGISDEIYAAYGGRIESDPARLADFHALQRDVTRVPCAAGNLALRADSAVASDHPLTALVADAAGELGRVLEVGGAFPEADLGEALDGLGASYDAGALADVPPGVAAAAAKVLVAAGEAAARRDAALAVLLPEGKTGKAFRDGPEAALTTIDEIADPDETDFAALYLPSDEGSGEMHAGAARLAQALDEADWDAAAAETGPFEFRATTPLGVVLLGGGTDDLHEDDGEAYLLVVDTGGHDTWRIPAGATRGDENPVSVLIDLGGDDAYGYEEVGSAWDVEGVLPADEDGRYRGDDRYGPFSLSATGRQGSGVLGYGMLVDKGGGRDTYRSLRRSQGFAFAGVGVLWDDGGDDTYEAEEGAQGVGLLGTGVLYDGGGADTFRAFHVAQGYGWVSGVGVLYDREGGDRFELEPDDPILYPSSQLPGVANASLGQGCAFGWRREDTETHWSGGIGLLRDADGDDQYTASTFAQGCGYWFGFGVLADARGDDRYNGRFYTQGASTHFALAAFLEGEGADWYDEEHAADSSSIGLAHDFSVTVFVEGGGDDRYVGPDRSLGAGKCHGLGLFFDLAGDDRYYATHERTIGWATDYDFAEGTCGDATTVPTWGLFVDTDGTDEYTKPDANTAANDTLWVNDDTLDGDALEYGGGVDVAGGVTYARAD